MLTTGSRLPLNNFRQTLAIRTIFAEVVVDKLIFFALVIVGDLIQVDSIFEFVCLANSDYWHVVSVCQAG